MSSKIIMSVVIGIILGLAIKSTLLIDKLDILVTFFLCLLLFWVGIDIGSNKDVTAKLKTMGIKVLLVPLCVAMGSIGGAALVGPLLNIPSSLSAAVGSGFGWYSLSAVIISDMHSAQLGTIAFLSNVLRELLAIMLIPIISKYIGHFEAIAPAGATAMDTSLPVISKCTSPEIAVVSFVTGVFLSSAVPILVPIFLRF